MYSLLKLLFFLACSLKIGSAAPYTVQESPKPVPYPQPVVAVPPHPAFFPPEHHPFAFHPPAVAHPPVIVPPPGPIFFPHPVAQPVYSFPKPVPAPVYTVPKPVPAPVYTVPKPVPASIYTVPKPSAVYESSHDKNAAIVSSYYNYNPVDFSFEYGFESDNGIGSEAKGYLKDGGQVITGSYTSFTPEGKPVKITYTADENGYVASGEGIPTPSPEIAKAVEYLKSLPPSHEDKVSKA